MWKYCALIETNTYFFHYIIYIMVSSKLGPKLHLNIQPSNAQISLKFVPKGPIENKTALVQVIALHQTGNKSLPEPMLPQFTDAYM